MKPANLPRNIARLEQLLEELRAQGVNVLFVTLPVTRFYRDKMQPGAYQRMQEALDCLTRKHQLEYLNYTFDPRFNDGDFQDGDHLNCRGAEKVSRLLGEEVVALGYSRPERASLPGAAARP